MKITSSSPPEEREQYFDSIQEKLFGQKNKPIVFKLDLPLVVGLIGQLQLAFRHPANTGPTRQMLEKFVIDLIERIDPEKGEVYQFLMLGFNSNFDI